MKSNMYQEIYGQPDLLIRKIKEWQAYAADIQPLIKEKSNIVLLGRGTSGNACVFASYLFGLTTGRHPIDFRPWLATQDTPFADWSDSVVIAYSQSGESTDIIHAAGWLKERGAKVVTITNSQSKTPSISKVSDRIFFLNVGAEHAVPATKTYSAQLFATAALAGLNIEKAIIETSEAMRAYLNSSVPEQLREFLNTKSVIIWLARGLLQAAALDTSLKLQETVGIPSFGWSTAEFLHGPIGSLQKNDCVIVFSEKENNVADSINKIIGILNDKGIDYRIMGKDMDMDNSLNIQLPSDNWAKTILFSFIGQHTALSLAEKRGLNPDKPGGLKKVTLT
jgi:glucosamine--fructose-6-phosphate aminotransferase (isomerizing)